MFCWLHCCRCVSELQINMTELLLQTLGRGGKGREPEKCISAYAFTWDWTSLTNRAKLPEKMNQKQRGTSNYHIFLLALPMLQLSVGEFRSGLEREPVTSFDELLTWTIVGTAVVCSEGRWEKQDVFKMFRSHCTVFIRVFWFMGN